MTHHKPLPRDTSRAHAPAAAPRDGPPAAPAPAGAAPPSAGAAFPPARPMPTAIAGAGGALAFELSVAEQGVHVMRVHRRADGSRVHCSVLFDDLESFTEWLDADPMRFTHPLVFQQVRRCFIRLVAQGAGDGPAGE